MYLQKVEIQGFKSFAENSSLEFKQELTAIVGPNGSGKSNVADAIRWVLGEQSLKLLRGKKAEDIIFSGSAKRPRMGMAEVSLYLNNADGQVDLDYPEIVITRRIYRDGESEIFINKAKAKLGDIQILLARANFGQKTYAIIGQGMIDSVVTATASERKEFFDEATGVKEYQIKREQAITKLERSQEALNESAKIIQEIEPRLNTLRRMVKRLEKKEILETEKQEKQIIYYSHLLKELSIQTKEVEEKINQLQAEKNTQQQNINELEKEISSLSDNNQVEAFQELQNSYQALLNQKNQLNSDLASLKLRQESALRNIGKSDLAWLSKQKDKIALELEKNLTEVRNNQSLLDQLLSDINSKNSEYSSILSELKNFQAQLHSTNSIQPIDSLRKVQRDLDKLIQYYQSFLAKIDQINSLDNVHDLKSTAENILSELRNISEISKSDQQLSSGEKDKLQSLIKNLESTKEKTLAELNELKTKQQIIQEKLNNAQKISQSQQSEIKNLELELAASQKSLSSEDISKIYNQEENDIQKSLQNILKEIEAEEVKIAQLSGQQKIVNEKNKNIQHQIKQLQNQLDSTNASLQELNIHKARIETKQEDLENEISREGFLDFKTITTENIDTNSLFADINRLKSQLLAIGGIDKEVATEYQEVSERYDFLINQSEDMKQAIKSCLEIIKELDKKIKEQFTSSFNSINELFQKYFKILFNGGVAKLNLTINESPRHKTNSNSDNPENSDQPLTPPTIDVERIDYGVEIIATPPGKKLQSIAVLSGGEKALTAIALISAIISNNPSPFVVLDEVDAALDEANSERFAQIVQELSKKTQFICITHNRATMHHAAILYGVTMQADGVSKLLSVNLKQAEEIVE